MRVAAPGEVQVHSEKAGDNYQRQRQCAVDGQHLHDFVGAIGDGGKIDIERAGQQVAMGFYQVHGAHQVVVYVAEVRIEIIAYESTLAADDGIHYVTHASSVATKIDQASL